MSHHSEEDSQGLLKFTSTPVDRREMSLALLRRQILKEQLSDVPDEQRCEKFAKPYKYTRMPARSIRLLKIYPYLVSRQEPLVVSLHVVDLDQGVPFDALSYTWGPPTWAARKEAATEFFVQEPRCYPVYCGNGIIRVTRNLRNALIHIRGWQTSSEDKQLFSSIARTAMSPYIWIDELCIDQDHLEERSQQVSIMGELYSKASLVLAWLGEHEPLTRSGFEMLRQLEQIADGTRRNGERVTSGSFRDEEFWARYGVGPFSNEQWRAYIDLITREWFTRTWIIQEIGLATKPAACLCGTSVLPTVVFLKIISFLQLSGWNNSVSDLLKQDYPKDQFDFILRLRTAHPFEWILNVQERTRKGDGYPFHLLQAYTFPNTFCFDPRDKVYATMALAAEFTLQGETTFLVDYKEPASDTYIRASRRSLEVSQSLDLLSITAHINRQDYQSELQSLPSWCPNYNSNDFLSGRPQPLDLQPDNNRSPNTFAASGNSIYFSAPDSPRSPELHLRGKLCGQTIEVSTTSINFQWEELSQLLDFLNGLEPPSSLSPAEMFWRTLVHDMYDPQNANQPYPASADTADCFFMMLYLQMIYNLRDLADMDDDKRARYHEFASKVTGLLQTDSHASRVFPDIAHYLSLSPTYRFDEDWWDADGARNPFFGDPRPTTALAFNIVSKGRKRRLFRTSDQRLGMGLETMRVGDEVWLLAGGQVPYALRPLADGKYEFVGEAYVHGIMMGESWPENEEDLVDVVLE